MIERVSSTVAATAVVSPWWLPSLTDFSEMAGLMLPILGVAFLVIQIVMKFTERK